MNQRIIMVVFAGSLLFGCVGLNDPKPFPGHGNFERPFIDFSKLWKSEREVRIQHFLSQAFVGGLPFNEMKRLSGDVETLSDLLETECGKNGKEHPFCSNLVATLGVIGGKEASEAIRKFLQQKEVSDFRSQTDGLMALGYGINQAEEKGIGANEDITGLISCISESSYQSILPTGNYGPNGSCPINTDDKKLTSEERDVVRSAIIGLGLSGSLKDDRVLKVLQALLLNAPANTSFRSLVMETLKAHGTIALDGLVCYYERQSSECRERLQTLPHAPSVSSAPRKPIKEKKAQEPRKDQQAPTKETDRPLRYNR